MYRDEAYWTHLALVLVACIQPSRGVSEGAHDTGHFLCSDCLAAPILCSPVFPLPSFRFPVLPSPLFWLPAAGAVGGLRSGECGGAAGRC